MFKKLILVSAMAFSISAVSYADATMKADKQSVDTACSADAATASCGTEQVGTGLLKCLHAYKKANPKYQFTASCKAAMQQMRADRKAGK